MMAGIHLPSFLVHFSSKKRLFDSHFFIFTLILASRKQRVPIIIIKRQIIYKVDGPSVQLCNISNEHDGSPS